MDYSPDLCINNIRKEYRNGQWWIDSQGPHHWARIHKNKIDNLYELVSYECVFCLEQKTEERLI